MSVFRKTVETLVENSDIGDFTKHPLWNDYSDYLGDFYKNNRYRTPESYHNTIGPLSFEAYVARREDGTPISSYETELEY